MKQHILKVGKSIVALSIVGAALVCVLILALAARSYFKTQQAAETQQTKLASDGTTHAIPIVWPDGSEKVGYYKETITPRSAKYTGPVNVHQSTIKMVSFNPLDSANKAGEGIAPPTFAEGDKPALVLDEMGIKTSKADGATSTGMGGSNPSWGEFLGWGGFIIFGLVALALLAGLFKWLASIWKQVEPGVTGAITGVLPTNPVRPL